MSPQRTSPVERFLGKGAVTGGPFAILGLDVRILSDDVIIGALEARLKLLAEHPERDTPEADEVRLALHAAAAQLLDPKVRRLLEARWRAAEAEAPRPRFSPRPTPAAPVAPATGTAIPLGRLRALEHDALLTLGIFGGWNRRSLRRLAVLAHARGASAQELAAALGSIATRPRAPGTPANGTRPPPPSAIVHEPSSYAGILAAIVVLCLAVLLVAVIALMGRLAGTGDEATEDPTFVEAPAEAEDAPIAWKPTPSDPPIRAPAERPAAQSEPAALVRELAACVEGLSTDREDAGARFDGAILAISSEWPRFPADQLAAVQNHIVEFLYRCDPGGAAAAVERLASGTDSLVGRAPVDAAGVRRAVFSMGVLARLTRERDLGIGAATGVETTLAEILGRDRADIEATFASGALAAARAIPSRLVGGPTDRAAWAGWRGAADALCRNNPELRAGLILSGLETLLIQAEEATSDRAVHETVADLLLALTWRDGDASRRHLLRWFDDRRISHADLQHVTSIIATRSSAERVDVTMVLSTSAIDAERAALRDRFARAWGIEGSIARDQLQGDWAVAARDAIRRSHEARDTFEHVAIAVELAHLSAAIEWHWRGDSDHAAELIGLARTLMPEADIDTPSPPGDPFASTGDGAWAVRYLSVGRSPAGRAERLNELAGRSGPLGPVDAEVVVAEALMGSPAEVRSRAQDVVRAHPSDAAVVNAVLEILPRLPRSVDARIVELVAQRRLPSPRSPAWALESRRALVERLLELIAGASPLAKIDELAGLLATGYLRRAADAPLTSDALRAAQVTPDRAAARLWSRWRREASTPTFGPRPAMSLEQIDLRRSGRLRVAEGLVQAFAAEQASLAEVLGYLVSVERPGASDRATVVLADLASERRLARDIVEQVSAGERAIARLWLLRTGEVLP